MLTDTSHSAMQAQDWLTPKDLQRELRIGEKLAYRLLKNGFIPSVRVGGLYRIYRPHLEEVLLEDPRLGKKKAESRNPAGSMQTPADQEVLLDSTA